MSTATRPSTIKGAIPPEPDERQRLLAELTQAKATSAELIDEVKAENQADAEERIAKQRARQQREAADAEVRRLQFEITGARPAQLREFLDEMETTVENRQRENSGLWCVTPHPLLKIYQNDAEIALCRDALAVAKQLDYSADPIGELANLRERLSKIRAFFGELNAKITKASDHWKVAQYLQGDIRESTLTNLNREIAKLHAARMEAVKLLAGSKPVAAAIESLKRRLTQNNQPIVVLNEVTSQEF